MQHNHVDYVIKNGTRT